MDKINNTQPQAVKVQSFDWGIIEWMHEPQNIGQQRISVGRTTLKVGHVQQTHAHQLEEQVIYVASGSGKHYLGGRCQKVEPGTVIHVPVGTFHYMVNTGDCPIKLIFVTVPSPGMGAVRSDPLPLENPEAVEFNHLLNTPFLQQIQDELVELSGLGVTVLDPDGNNITRPGGLPEFCRKMQELYGKSGVCSASSAAAARKAATRQKPTIFLCCSDLVCLLIPIRIGQQFLGAIRCGHVFLNRPEGTAWHKVGMRLEDDSPEHTAIMESYQKIKVIPKARLYAAAEALNKITGYFVKTSAYLMAQKQINDQNAKIIEQMELRMRIEKALKDAELRLLQYQIKPHFLFNALNTIASLAVLGNAAKTEEAIHALGSLLRYTIVKSDGLVPIREELKHVTDYLSIQNLRLGDRLKVLIEVPEEIQEVRIPFMTLQPLVENAIVHGIEPKRNGGTIRISCCAKGGQVTIKIEDSGGGMSPEVVNCVNERIFSEQSGSRRSLGLSNVIDRLTYYYGEGFDFKAETLASLTAITIVIPAN